MSATTNRIQGCTASPDVKEVLELMRKEYMALSGAGGETGGGGASASVVTDLNNLHAAVVHTLTHLDELGAKLNADEGVTDTDYYTENELDDSPPPIETVVVDPANASGGMS